MAKGINLRGDLTKLHDAELAERLQQAWEVCDATRERPRWSWLLNSHRGPIRHPKVYRFFAILGNGAGSWLDLVFATMLSSKRFEGLIAPDNATARHLALCEIRDINDEIERRMKARGRQS